MLQSVLLRKVKVKRTLFVS